MRLFKGKIKLFLISSVLLFFFITYSFQKSSNEQDSLNQLRILKNDQMPVAHFFRTPEQQGRRASTTWDEWYSKFSRLMGIEGKALSEEVLANNEKVRQYFSRFKELHPDQVVLLHFNGRARDPIYERGPFFAGHWIYFEGATIESDLPAEEGIFEVRVSDVNLFKTNIGLRNNKNEDIGFCRLNADGTPDWHNSEQVRLVDIDHDSGIIKVERGCYGTKPMSFKAGNSYAAAHVSEGPWGSNSNLMWYYNFSPLSPRDKNGKQAVDILTEQLSSWFKKGGRLEKFDGVEFDVLHHVPMPAIPAGRGMDLNADGKPDDGVFDGVQTYGIGVVNYVKDLRKHLGNDKMIMADNDRWFHQRAVGILNGIESETFPTGADDNFEDWAGGINRLLFWAANSDTPSFNYIARPDSRRIPDVRLMLAAAALTDAGVSMKDPNKFNEETKGSVLIWDELQKGQENVLGWLGKGIAPAQRMATVSRNLMVDGVGLRDKISSSNCKIDIKREMIQLSNEPGNEKFMEFQIGEFKTNGQDLLVMATVKADPMTEYPEEVARLMYVDVSGGEKGSLEKRVVKNMALVNEKPFRAGFYFRKFSDPASLSFHFEGNEPVTISDIAVYSAPDVMVRKFEGGLVIANPSEHDVKIDLKKVWAGEKFRRIIGSDNQDPVTNNGQTVNGKLTVGPLDAIFLVREK